MTKKRPEVVEGKTRYVDTRCGRLFLTLNRDEDELYEVELTMAKPGACAYAWLPVMGYLITLAIQGGWPLEKVLERMEKRTCEGVRPGEYCLAGITRIIKEEVNGEGSNN